MNDSGIELILDFNFIDITQKGQPQGVAPTTMSLSDIVHRFKTLTTKQYTDGVKINHVSCPRNPF